MSEQSDRAVRLHVYRRFVDSGSPPSVAETARALSIAEAKVEESYRQLDAGRALVLRPGTQDVWMAMPFSAVPTSFEVRAGERTWWANCAWDALGIPAALGRDAVVSTTCDDCDERLVLEIEGGPPPTGEGVVHFAVPAARWWEDIGFT